MQHRPRIEQLWRVNLEPYKWPLWAALTPLSVLYRCALALRTLSRFHIERAQVPVISVGNLTVGGNAKTPFTLYLAELLQSHGYKVGIVSRGYGGDRRDARLVAEGGRLLLTVAESGDEPAMMAYHFDGPIAVARKRIEAIRLLADHAPLDAVILDDGFQHRRLHRDLDLVVVAARSGFGNGWLLPAGPLREPLKALERADTVVIISSSDDGADRVAKLKLVLPQPLLQASIQPSALVQVSGDQWLQRPIALQGRRVVAVSGLANPAAFTTMLTRLGAEVESSLVFADHHRYSPRDWEAIRSAASRTDLIITTEKDLVKLQAFSPHIASLYALRLGIVVDAEDEGRFLEIVIDRIRNFATKSPLPHEQVSARN